MFRVRAIFGRKITNLTQLEEATKAAIKGEAKGTPYEVTKEIRMSDAEFRRFSEDLLADHPWINETDGGHNQNVKQSASGLLTYY